MTADFTFDYYEKIFSTALINNYQVITLKEFFNDEYDKDGKVLINRIDVDIKINRLHKIYYVFNKLKIKASIFFRLHASEYNLLTISNIKLAKKLIAIGCEIRLYTKLKAQENTIKDSGKVCREVVEVVNNGFLANFLSGFLLISKCDFEETVKIKDILI